MEASYWLTVAAKLIGGAVLVALGGALLRWHALFAADVQQIHRGFRPWKTPDAADGADRVVAGVWVLVAGIGLLVIGAGTIYGAFG